MGLDLAAGHTQLNAPLCQAVSVKLRSVHLILFSQLVCENKQVHPVVHTSCLLEGTLYILADTSVACYISVIYEVIERLYTPS